MNSAWMGQTEYCEGTLGFDVESLEIKAEANSKYKGSFHILAHGAQPVVGNIYTTDYRMSCSEKSFRGRDLEIPFLYDTTGMEYGDVVRGEFYIISSMGEYYFPYEVKIVGTVMQSELGEIKNLFHFANLAKVNWQQARQCFEREDFVQLLTGSARQYVEVYHGLLEHGREHACMDYAMEQFLILIRKKQPVTFRFAEEKLKYNADELPRQLVLTVEKNGWGYIAPVVKVKGSFVKEYEQTLLAEDFENGSAKIVLDVNPKGLYTSRNIAEVTLKSFEGDSQCKVLVEKTNNREQERIYQFHKKQLISIMMRLYLDYRTGRKPVKECVSLAGEVLEQARGINELMPALYQAHMKLLTGQMNEAVWLLKHAKRMMEGKEMPLEQYGYFLYLTAMSDCDDKKRAGELLEQYIVQYPQCFILYWGYMHKENLMQHNPGTVYRRMKEFWENGSFSPLLYLEAALIVLDQPAVLGVMDSFELQLLLFMERYDLLPERIYEQIYHAAESMKGYSPLLVRMLSEHPIKDKKKMMKVLCLQYMRGACKGKKAAAVFRTGIEEECRITGLYEAYIRALEFEQGEVLPKLVVHYFAFESSLDDVHLAYVYAKIIRQQETIREEYDKKIRNFVIKQLHAGRIDENLAYLYRNLLNIEDMNPVMQKQLLELAFTHVITVRNPGYSNCIVRHEGMRGQRKYTIKMGRAMAQIYSDDYILLFEDEKGLLHCPEQGYDVLPLLGYERMKPLLKACEEVTFGQQFHRFRVKPVEQIDNVYEFRRAERDCRWLLKQEHLTEAFRKELAGSLLRAYAKWDVPEELDDFLASATAEDFHSHDVKEFIFLLCNRGFYEKAFQIASVQGYEKLDNRVLARLCQFMIEKKEGMKDSHLLKLTYQVFEHGKYTESMLEYLICWFGGTVKQMRKIWKAAVAMDISATDLSKRILQQILVTGAYIADREQIFSYYCEKEGESQLVRTYLSMRANDYLLRDEILEDSIMDKLQRDLICGAEYPLGAKLAVLKYNSERIQELSKEQLSLCTELLAESLGADIYFSYYAAYVQIYPILELYGEASYIEIMARPEMSVTIHYILDGGKNEAGGYCKEEMEEIYPGIYQKSFRMFWGEKLQYYITCCGGKEEQFMMSGSMERGEAMDENSHGRFRLLNDIALSMELRDYHTAENLVCEYAENSFLTDKMLRIK